MQPTLRFPRKVRSFTGRIGSRDMSLILLIVIIVVLFGGGGGYYAHRSYGGRGLGGVLGLLVVILLILWLVGGLHGAGPAPV
jgi:hypothetical protein